MLYLALAALLFPMWASASDFECNYAGSQREMNACAIQEYRASFNDYTRVYQKTMNGMNAKERARLKAQSDSWAQIVRKQCIRASRRTGSDETILFYSCLQQVTEHRTLSLRARHTQV